jgi:hypothetical protein
VVVAIADDPPFAPITTEMPFDPWKPAEFCRASDRALAKFEMRPIAYRRMVRRMLDMQEQLDTESTPSPRLVIPEPSTVLSEQPLPSIL